MRKKVNGFFFFEKETIWCILRSLSFLVAERGRTKPKCRSIRPSFFTEKFRTSAPLSDRDFSRQYVV